MRILLTGATGLIGGALAAALESRGHALVLCVRDPLEAGRRWPGRTLVQADFSRDIRATDWSGRLAGVDVAINAVGILREHGDQSFDALHVRAPIALFEACAAARVSHVVQISALGADADAVSRYHRSKREADRALALLPLRATIVRPSLVFSPRGASTRWFAMLATLPVIVLPGGGRQCIQPIHLHDLVDAIVRIVEGANCASSVDAVGAEPTTLLEYLLALRGGLGLDRPRVVASPMWMMRLLATMGDHVPGVMLDRENLQMLERGNCADASSITRALGHPPRAIEQFVVPADAAVMRNVALLGWLLPLLRVSIAAVWIVTGIMSLGIYPVAQSTALLARVGLHGTVATIALYGAALLDLALGVATLALRRRQWLYVTQGLLILAYTVLISVRLPEYWLHPYGPVLKNLPMLASLLLLHALDRRDQTP